MRVSMVSVAVVLAACSSGSQGASSPTDKSAEAPAFRENTQYTRVTMSNAVIEIDWQHKQTYESTQLLVPVEKAWEGFPAVFGELGIAPGVVDSKQHVFGNAGENFRGSLGRQHLSHYFDCGSTAGMANADNYDVLVRVISQVVPSDAGLATLRTEVEASGHPTGVTGNVVRCASTGALEARLARMLSEQTAKPPA